MTTPLQSDLVEVGEAVEPGEGVEEHLLPLVGEHHHCELALRAVALGRRLVGDPRPRKRLIVTFLTWDFRRNTQVALLLLNLM